MDTSATPWTTKVRGRFRGRMASGVVALVPIVVTVAVLRFLFSATSSVLLPLIGPAVAAWPPLARAALSLAILLAVIYVLGELATNLVGRRILAFVESVVLRVPLVKVVYSASKQVAAAFDGQKARAFKSVVYIEFPRQGMRAIGFETSTTTDDSGAVWSTVFVPTTPNPTTGFLQIVPAADVIRTDYSVEDGIKIVMSLGVLAPEFEMRA
jgi:uncharacterized membrane protein